MKTYLDYYVDWYPTTYNLKHYPNKSNKLYTIGERKRLLNQLTKRELALVNNEKKYMLRSLFISKQFLEDTEWRFVEFNTDREYNRSKKKYSLYCECGKALKYQFVVQSQKTKKKLKLGITHFTDHLNVSPQIANEIKKGVNKIDIALDELLWLKERGYNFPEDLWKRYSFAHYRNNTLNEPVKLNRKLASRIIDFRECNMPIFISDYHSLYNEIKKINHAALFGEEETFIKKRDVFENYYHDLSTNQRKELYDTDIFLSKNLNKEILYNTKVPIKDINYYFKKLFDLLMNRKSNIKLTKKEINDNLSITKENKILNDNVLDELTEAYNKYGMSDNFYLSLPKSMRIKFTKFHKKIQNNISNEQSMNVTKVEGTQVVNIQDTVKEDIHINYWNSIVRNLLDIILFKQQDKILENKFHLEEDNLCDILSIIDQIEKKQEIESDNKEMKLQLDQNTEENFINFLHSILSIKANVHENDLINLLINLFDVYGIDDWPLIYNLLEARYKLKDGENFDNAFSKIPQKLKEDLYQSSLE